MSVARRILLNTRRDIPEKLDAAFTGAYEELEQDVTIFYGKPLGADARIVDILLDRITAAIE